MRHACAVQSRAQGEGRGRGLQAAQEPREASREPVLPSQPTACDSETFHRRRPCLPTRLPACSSHPKVAKIAFTGSVGTGRRVYAAAAGNLRPATMELGGKSGEALARRSTARRRARRQLLLPPPTPLSCAGVPAGLLCIPPPPLPPPPAPPLLPLAALIVFEDADVDKAVEWAMFGVFWTCGQVGAHRSWAHVGSSSCSCSCSSGFCCLAPCCLAPSLPWSLHV